MSGSNPAGAANFKRQSWDKAEYEERARRRQQMIEEAVRSGADDEDVTARIMEAERLIGTQARGETATAEELRERAVKALSASAGAAGPMASERAWLHRRKFDVSIDDKVGTRKIVTESTVVNNRGGFYVPVTGVTLSNSIAFLDHINGRKYQQALGYSMRVERKGADDVSSKLRALRAQSRAEEENAAALAAAKASGQDIGREVYNRRVAAAEEEEEARRQRERERRRQRRRRKYGHVDDGDDDFDDDDEAVDGGPGAGRGPANSQAVASSFSSSAATAPLAGARGAGASEAHCASSSGGGSSGSSSSSSSSNSGSSSSATAAAAAADGAAAAPRLQSAAGALQELVEATATAAAARGVMGIQQSGGLDAGLAEILGVSVAPHMPWGAIEGVLQASAP